MTNAILADTPTKARVSKTEAVMFACVVLSVLKTFRFTEPKTDTLKL